MKPKAPKKPLSEQELNALLKKVVDLDLALQDAADSSEQFSSTAGGALSHAAQEADRAFKTIKALADEMNKSAGPELTLHEAMTQYAESTPRSEVETQFASLLRTVIDDLSQTNPAAAASYSGAAVTASGSSDPISAYIRLIDEASLRLDSRFQSFLELMTRELSGDPSLPTESATSQFAEEGVIQKNQTRFGPTSDERSIGHEDLLRQMTENADRSVRLDRAAFGGGNLGAAGISPVELTGHMRPHGRGLSELAKLIEEAVGLEAAKKADEFIRRSSFFSVTR